MADDQLVLTTPASPLQVEYSRTIQMFGSQRLSGKDAEGNTANKTTSLESWLNIRVRQDLSDQIKTEALMLRFAGLWATAFTQLNNKLLIARTYAPNDLYPPR